jgi:hypothetical protein
VKIYFIDRLLYFGLAHDLKIGAFREILPQKMVGGLSKTAQSIDRQ